MQLRADFKIYARRVERTERCKRICGVKYGAKFNAENLRAKARPPFLQKARRQIARGILIRQRILRARMIAKDLRALFVRGAVIDAVRVLKREFKTQNALVFEIFKA